MTRPVHLPPLNLDLIRSLLKQLGHVEVEAPFIFLLPGERKALSGSYFFDAPIVVQSVAQAIIDKPALFQGCGEDGHDLMKDFHVGSALDATVDRLENLLAAAKDTRTAFHAGNIRRAWSVLGFVRRDEEAVLERRAITGEPPAQEVRARLEDRRSALRPAQRILDSYYGKLKARKSQKRAERAAALGEAAPAPSPRVVAARDRARQEGKDGARLLLLEEFEDKLHRPVPLAQAASDSAKLGVGQGDAVGGGEPLGRAEGSVGVGGGARQISQVQSQAAQQIERADLEGSLTGAAGE